MFTDVYSLLHTKIKHLSYTSVHAHTI